MFQYFLDKDKNHPIRFEGELSDENLLLFLEKYLIDNALINKILLEEAGLLKENIIDSKICSVCNKDYIHSRRAEGPDFGLGGLFISL